MIKKPIVLFLAAAAVVLAGGVVFRVTTASESSLKWRSFNDGIAEAKSSKKKVLIDVYTDWCVWCKRMDANTYSDAGVAEYLRKHYVLIKLNAESNRKVNYKDGEYTERELAAAFGINGYPSTLFLKSDAEPITIYPGYADAKQFKKVLSFIAEDYYLTKKFEEYAPD